MAARPVNDSDPARPNPAQSQPNPSPTLARVRGRVQSRDRRGRCGLIDVPSHPNEYFFYHWSAVEDLPLDLRPGENVEIDATRLVDHWMVTRLVRTDLEDPPETTGVPARLDPAPSSDSAQAKPPKYDEGDQELPDNPAS